MKVLILILLLTLCLAETAYQQRRIYYNEDDNVCRYGASSDKINIVVQLDGNVVISEIVMGNTYCRDWTLRYSDKIIPGQIWGYITKDGTRLIFKETSKYEYSFGFLASIIQNTRIETAATIIGVMRDCTIVGNGEIFHYGAPGLKFETHQYYVRCTTPSVEQVK